MKWTPKKFSRSLLVAIAVALLAGAALVLWERQPARPGGSEANPAGTAKMPAVASSAIPNTLVSSNAVAAVAGSQREARFASFQKHPFPAARESHDYGWTAEDGKDADVIRQLAHNELGLER